MLVDLWKITYNLMFHKKKKRQVTTNYLLTKHYINIAYEAKLETIRK